EEVRCGKRRAELRKKKRRKILSLDPSNAGSIAGHYGAVSSVTLAACIVFLDQMKVPFERFIPALYPFTDTAALITAIVLGRAGVRAINNNNENGLDISAILREAITSKPSVLLLGGFIIGFINGAQGIKSVMPFFDTLFPGVITLFMLDMGLLATVGLRELKTVNKHIFSFALLMPPLHALAAILLATAIGLSPGGATIFSVLAAGASYISAPVVMRTALPQANPSLSFGIALGITFPFNVTVGIPLYYQIAVMAAGLFP
ncbi:uncharacterized protein HKBW3S09_01007, partial [Candidatus Hakubella thermalkaliphila]